MSDLLSTIILGGAAFVGGVIYADASAKKAHHVKYTRKFIIGPVNTVNGIAVIKTKHSGTLNQPTQSEIDNVI